MAAAKTTNINGERKNSNILSHFGNNFQRPSRMRNSGEKVSQESIKAMDLPKVCLSESFIFVEISFPIVCIKLAKQVLLSIPPSISLKTIC